MQRWWLRRHQRILWSPSGHVRQFSRPHRLRVRILDAAKYSALNALWRRAATGESSPPSVLQGHRVGVVVCDMPRTGSTLGARS